MSSVKKSLHKQKRLTPFVKSLFPTNLKLARLQPTIHFTETTLHHMTPYRKAQRICSLLDKTMQVSSYAVVDCCAGIGGNTMAFADHPSIHQVFAFEPQPSIFAMLQNNLANVHLANTVCATNACFQLTQLDSIDTCACPAVALFIDPPWGGDPPYTSNLLLQPLMGGENVVQWIQGALLCKNVGCVVVKVPKGHVWNKELTPASCVMEYNTSLTKMDMFVFKRGVVLL